MRGRGASLKAGTVTPVPGLSRRPALAVALAVALAAGAAWLPATGHAQHTKLSLESIGPDGGNGAQSAELVGALERREAVVHPHGGAACQLGQRFVARRVRADRQRHHAGLDRAQRRQRRVSGELRSRGRGRTGRRLPDRGATHGGRHGRLPRRVPARGRQPRRCLVRARGGQRRRWTRTWPRRTRERHARLLHDPRGAGRLRHRLVDRHLPALGRDDDARLDRPQRRQRRRRRPS